MKNIFLLLAVCVLAGSGVLYISLSQRRLPFTSDGRKPTTEVVVVSEVAGNLEVPWAIAFLPDDGMLVTERAGRIRYIDTQGTLDATPVLTIGAVKAIGEGGLLGIALHPNFSSNHFVYLYYTYDSSGDNTKNRVVRMKYDDKKLSDEEIIVDNIPGASNHNGGRIKFGPDGNLYIGTGDAQDPSQAQDTSTFGGKILRVTDRGTEVYSYGHRNVQGLTWNSEGELWATEHGRSGVQSGLDELNLIESGNNYGWPEIEGNETSKGMITPKRNSGNITWAPSGGAFLGNSLFFAGLRGSTLYEAIIQNGKVTEVKEHFKGQFGRIREVVLGPDGMLYITTSNTDGRGIPKNNDDQVIRVNPKSL